MRNINLLPPEVAERRRVRQQSGLLVVLFVAFLALLAVIWFFRNLEVGRQEDRRDRASAEARGLQVQVTALQEFADLEKSVEERRETLSTIMQGDVAWSRLLIELSMIIPGDSWLTAFTGTVADQDNEQPPATQPSTAGAAAPPTKLGELTFVGNTFDFPGVAKWISRLQELKSLQNIWVSSATKSLIGTRDVIGFSSTSDLSPASASNRFQEGAI